MPICRSACFALLAALLVSGCKDRQISTYRAPKDPPPAAMPPVMASPNAGALPEGHPPVGQAGSGDMASTAVPTGSDSLSWTAPAQWTAKPLGPMRKGSFAVKGPNGAEADLSITSFPGNTGGLVANLNRWRGQIALPPLSEAQVTAALEHLDANGLRLELVDFVGTANGAPSRILGAILSRPGETWFFKLMGPDALVAGQKDAFRDFLRSVKEPAK